VSLTAHVRDASDTPDIGMPGIREKRKLA